MKKNKLPYHQDPGFKVPPNYFEDLEERLLNAAASENSLRSIEKKKIGFIIPENYFDDLERRVLQKIEGKQVIKEEKGKLIPLISREAIYYVAAVAAIFIFIFSTIDLNPKVEQEYNMNSVELSALEEYINNGYLDFNFMEVTSFLSEEDYVLQDFDTADFSDEEVLNYLTENIEDPNLLLE